GEGVSAVRVVARRLEERLPGALRDAAVHLAFDDRVIDDAADVVAGRDAREARLAGFRIELDLDDLRAVRPRRRRRSLGGGDANEFPLLRLGGFGAGDRTIGAGECERSTRA